MVIVEERLAKLEAAVAVLQAENLELRRELAQLQGREPGETDEATPKGRAEWWLKKRWPLVALALTIAIPVLSLTVWGLGAFRSTAIAFVNGLLIYLIGPQAWALFVEGIFRAIPGVLFGQATRIAVDKYRSRQSK